MIAITREVSENLGRCELTHLARVAIDVERAREQHAAYEAALRGLGVEVVRARAEPAMPDAVFVEDMAVVLPEGAVMTRPGAAARRGEVAGVAEVLGKYRPLHEIQFPGRLDGGDVLRMGQRILVGRTARTNASGIEQLRKIAGAWDYDVQAVAVRGCLHLKSAVTQVAEETVLLNPEWVALGVFGFYDPIVVDPREAYAGNGLLVKGRVIYPEHFPRTRERLERRGVKMVAVACDELAKAEGAVTCCSLLVEGE